ncbi:MAG: SIR2 family protein [Pseudomonadota bacterium]
MRFIENGADIPDDLLLAHDEGQVVFFCGSGVSAANAKLPNFDGLAKSVLATLGVDENNEIRKFYDAAKRVEKEAEVKGVFSPDRIFSLLGRQFDKRTVNNAVAESLSIKTTARKLQAHKTILSLARGQNTPLRLVTTNFDRLFEAADPGLMSCTRSNLPHVQFNEDEWGIVHLHGQVNPDYSGADRDGFVLSSSEFGDAYLAHGWAREFVRAVLEKYITVFIGYSADDPPIRYLLEGLRESGGYGRPIYAFQDADDEDAIASWGEKQVHPIPFSKDNDYKALWSSLETWAKRAADPELWKTKVLKRAGKGPEGLKPFERGQVAHLVSSTKNSVSFKNHKPPIPATWLCVFDKSVRFARPEKADRYDENSPVIDPYALYALDSDPPPIGDNEKYANQQIPEEAWSAFDLTEQDLASLTDNQLPAFYGHNANKPANLPRRLTNIGIWFGNVADQPAAAWWAAKQLTLHPDVKWMTDRTLRPRGDKKVNRVVLEAWRDIFDFYREYDPSDLRQYDLQEQIAHTGWSIGVVEQYAKIFSPTLKMQNLFRAPIPPTTIRGLRKDHIVRLDIDYPDQISQFTVPDDQLISVISAHRRNIEAAIDREKETSGWLKVSSIEPDDHRDAGDDDFDRKYELSGYVLHFVGLFNRLFALDKKAACQEYRRWRETDPIFKRMRFWAAGKAELANPEEFGREIISIDRELFWNSDAQRDLLLVLSRRWLELSAQSKKKIEKMLRRGRRRYQNEEREEFERYSAHSILSRLYWMRKQECEFSFDFDKVTSKLREKAPDWIESYADGAAVGRESYSGWVETDTNWDEYRRIPVNKLIEKLLAAPRRRARLTEFDPFLGICDEAPNKALAALKIAATKKEFPTQYWSQFLERETRKDDSLRLVKLIAGRLIQIPPGELRAFLLSVTRWFKKHDTTLRSNAGSCFQALWEHCIDAMRSGDEGTGSTVIRGKNEPDWMTEAINAPAGDLAEILMTDPRKNDLKAGKGYPKSWLEEVRKLLALPSPSREYALVIFSYNLSWFYLIDPKFSEEIFLSVLDDPTKTLDQDAIWAGFFAGARLPGETLYKKIKPHIIKMAKREAPQLRREAQTLSGILLAGWGSKTKNGKRLVTDKELKSALLNANEDFRGQSLWHLTRWSGENKKGWAPQIIPFLENVWPKERKVRSKIMSTRLCELAFSQQAQFPKIVDAILPLISRVEGDNMFLPALRDPDGANIKNHPDSVLTLLYAVLPEDASRWPYNARQVLGQIEETKPELARNPKMMELRARLSEV